MRFESLLLLVENIKTPKVWLLPFNFNGTRKAAFYLVYGLKAPDAATQAEVDALMSNEKRFLAATDKTQLPTEADKQRLHKAKLRVREVNSMLADILDVLSVVYMGGDRCRTFSVDSKGNIYINLGFANLLSDNQLAGVLAHEAMHIILSHHLRLKGRTPFKIANIATDAYINSDLKTDGFELPPEGVQAQYNKLTLPVMYVDNDVPDIKLANPQVYNIEIDLNKKNWETVFEEIKTKLETKQDIVAKYEVGDVIYDEAIKKYGVVSHVDAYGGGGITVDYITPEQARQLALKKGAN